MGFEIKFFYKEFDKENNVSNEIKNFTKEVGTESEDTDLKDVVKVIINQYARRDILVVDLEAYEFIKKKISVKNTKGGIVIKNKKFLLDSDANIVVQEVAEESNLLVVKPNNLVNLAQPVNGAVNLVQPSRPSRPIKWVTLDPDLRNLDIVKSLKVAFIPDRRYPVFSETAHPKKFGVMVYQIMDDNKREVAIEDTYFLNADQILQQGFFSSVDKDEGAPKLKFDDSYKDVIPDIRRR